MKESHYCMAGGFLAGLVLGVAGFWMVGLASSPNPGQGGLEVRGPGGSSIRFEYATEGVDYLKILEDMFRHALFRPGVEGWLREQHKIYPIESETVVTAIRTELCPGAEPTDWAERFEWRRVCAEKPTVSSLRGLADGRQVPFHYLGRLGTMGIPSSPYTLPRGRANVCRNGPFHGKRLQVQNPLSDDAVEVDAHGYYVCATDNFPDIQLSPDDASSLFSARPLARLENVLIIPL